MKRIGDIRRQEIMEHFYRVVSAHGFSGTTLAKVAESMGVKPSLLLHYYASKEEMVAGFIDFIISKYEEVYIDRIHGISDPRERLSLLLDLLFTHDISELVNDKAFYESYALSLTDPEVREKFSAFYARFRLDLKRELDELAAAGVIRPLDSLQSADLLIVLLEGKDFYANLIRDEGEFEKLLARLRDMTYRILAKPDTGEKENGK